MEEEEDQPEPETMSREEALKAGFTPYQEPAPTMSREEALKAGFEPYKEPPVMSREEALKAGFTPYEEEKAEGVPATVARQAAHEVLPMAAGAAAARAGGVLAGRLLGGALGSWAGPVGTIGGALAGGMAASYLQEKILPMIGMDDSHRLAVNAKAHPYAAMTGEAAGVLPFFGPGAAPKIARVAGGALVGGTEAARQLYEGEFDPGRLAAGVATGAILAKPTALTRGIESRVGGMLGERAAAAAPAAEAGPPPAAGAPLNVGRVREHAETIREQGGAVEDNPYPLDSRAYSIWDDAFKGTGAAEDRPHGTAGPRAQAPSEPVPPPHAESATQEAQNQAVRSDRQYGKRAGELPGEEAPRPGVNRVEYTDPDLDFAIAQKQAEVTGGEPPNIFQQIRSRLDQERAARGEPPGRPLEFPERVPPIEPGRPPAPGGESAARPAEPAAVPPEQPAAARAVSPAAEAERRLQPAIEARDEAIARARGEPRPVGEPVEELPPGAVRLRQAMARKGRGFRIGREGVPEAIVEAAGERAGIRPEGERAVIQEALQRRPGEAPPGAPPEPPIEIGGPPRGRGPAGPEGFAAPPDFTPQKPSAWRSFLGAVAPTLRSKYARQKANEINAAHGEFNQIREQIMDRVDPRRLDVRKGGGAREVFNTLETTNPERLRALVNQMQGGTTFKHVVPTAQERAAMADVQEGGFGRWASVLQKEGLLDRFVDEYLPGQYKDQEKARDAIAQFRTRGNSGMTLAKMFSNYEQARVVAGLEPKTMNPVDMLDLYSQNAKDLLTAKRLETNFLNSGEFKRMKEAPAGWSQIMTGKREPTGIYAPDDLARVWNNWVDQGMKARHKEAVEAVQHLTNAWTTFELGINGYHMVTMAHEAVSHDLARAFSQLFAGRPLEAAMTAIKAPAAPISTFVKGKKTIADWLDPNHQSPGMDLLRDADVRFIGRGHAADTMMARKGFLDLLSSEGWRSQFRKAWYDARRSVAEAPTVLGKGKAIFDNVGRVMQTVSTPIFDVYIPMIKAGAIMKNVEDWLASNQHLDLQRGSADWGHAVDQIRKIANTVDNRFGEMITDHLFLNRTMQQSAQIGMRSFSWALGSMKEIAGGAASVGQGAANQILGRDASLLQRLQMGSEHYDPRIAYLVGFPTALAFFGVASQFLMTGEKPRDPKDLFLPRTGGKVAGYGGKGRVDERLLLPGYMKDVLAWTHHPLDEMYRKLNGLATTSYETARGEDALNRPFVNPKGSALDQVADRAHYFMSKMGPISIRNYIQGQKPGSNIPSALAAFGFRAPGAEWQDPEGYRRGMEARQERGFKSREKSIQRQQRQAAPETRGFAHGGPVRPPRERFLQRRNRRRRYQEGGEVYPRFRLEEDISPSALSRRAGIEDIGTARIYPTPMTDPQFGQQPEDWLSSVRAYRAIGEMVDPEKFVAAAEHFPESKNIEYRYRTPALPIATTIPAEASLEDVTDRVYRARRMAERPAEVFKFRRGYARDG